jgi:hypothetical protein
MSLIGGVMVSMLVSSVVEHGFKPQSGQPKTIDFLSKPPTALRSK